MNNLLVDLLWPAKSENKFDAEPASNIIGHGHVTSSPSRQRRRRNLHILAKPQSNVNFLEFMSSKVLDNTSHVNTKNTDRKIDKKTDDKPSDK